MLEKMISVKTINQGFKEQQLFTRRKMVGNMNTIVGCGFQSDHHS